jgi:hypothetical protein
MPPFCRAGMAAGVTVSHRRRKNAGLHFLLSLSRKGADSIGCL